MGATNQATRSAWERSTRNLSIILSRLLASEAILALSIALLVRTACVLGFKILTWSLPVKQPRTCGVASRWIVTFLRPPTGTRKLMPAYRFAMVRPTGFSFWR